jgi:polyisoprenoid-binding protein YceI
MRYIKKSASLFIVLSLATAFTFIISDKKKIVADKKKTFVSYHMVHPLHEWTATSNDVNSVILYNPETKAIESVAVSVSLSTFDSKNSNRDSHALEILEAIQYPSVKFTSNDIKQNGDDLTINGNLTFHNITKPITILAKQSFTKNELTVDGTFNVNITDYKIEVPSLMGIKTGEEITMNFKVVFPV